MLASRLRVLYDGWPLACAPGSPQALHLLELFEKLPAEVEPWLALPGPPGPLLPDLPVRPVVEPVQASPGGRLRWEQHVLPAIARRAQVHLLHTTTALPVLHPVPCLVSPVESFSQPRDTVGVVARLREALAYGGLSSARVVLWPTDLPDPPGQRPLLRLGPYVHSAFFQEQPPLPGLPENYIFCPGMPTEQEVTTLLEAWQIASPALGEDWALVFADLPEDQVAFLRQLAQGAGLPAPVQHVALSTPQERASAIQRAGLVLDLGPILPWGDPFLQALACARPVTAFQTEWADARAGPAGYLAPAGNGRVLAAAILTLLVEEPVAEALQKSAALRAAGWQGDGFHRRLVEIYAEVARAGG